MGGRDAFFSLAGAAKPRLSRAQRPGATRHLGKNFNSALFPPIIIIIFFRIGIGVDSNRGNEEKKNHNPPNRAGLGAGLGRALPRGARSGEDARPGRAPGRALTPKRSRDGAGGGRGEVWGHRLGTGAPRPLPGGFLGRGRRSFVGPSPFFCSCEQKAAPAPASRPAARTFPAPKAFFFWGGGEKHREFSHPRKSGDRPVIKEVVN